MEALALAEIILGFMALVAVGAVLRHFGVLSREDTRPINAIIIYAGLPALIFRAVHGAELGPDLALVAGVAWIVFAASAAAAWLLARLLRLSPATTGAFILAASLGNTGYLGYPVSLAVLGDEGLVRAIFYDVFGTVGALLLVGLLIAERFGHAEETPINLVREVLKFPAVGALAIGLALRGVRISGPLSDGIDALATLVVPLIMISVGLSLKRGSVRSNAVPLLALGAVKLALAPLVALGAGSAILADPEAVRLVVLEAGMPSMMLALVIGARFRLDTGFIAAAILLTTAASAVTVPLALGLLGG